MEEKEIRELITDLRKKHGDNLYLIRIGEHDFVFRLLSRQDMMDIYARAYDDYSREELICQKAVVWPERIDFSTYLAGIPKQLAPVIVELSGFTNPDSSISYLLEHYRNIMATSFEAQAEVFIKVAFPEITFAEMKEWDLPTLIEHLARAEFVMKNIKGLPVEFSKLNGEGEVAEKKEIDPKEEARKLRESGIDPMLLLDPKTLREPYLTMPVIGGTKWSEEAVIHGIQQQIQRLSGR